MSEDFEIVDSRLNNPEVKKHGVVNPYLYNDKTCTLKLPEYTAKIEIGDWTIQLTNKTFTDEQIKNMREMLGWEVTNL